MQNSVLTYLSDLKKGLPDKELFVDEKCSVTVSEFYEKVCRIATHLLNNNIHNCPVGVYIEKSVDALCAYLGVAASGNFYCPLDVDMPNERLNSIMEILKPGCVIYKNSMFETMTSLKTCGYDACLKADMDEKKIIESIERIIDTDPLYVLFTSGSTGVPKGVVVCHRSVIDYIDWLTDTFDISDNDSIGNQAPFYFDNSVFDIYLSLKTGAKTTIIPKRMFGFPLDLLKYVTEKKINMVFWVPSVLCAAVNLRALKSFTPTTLNKIFFAGEVMPNKQLNAWRQKLPDALYVNLYGPTEITVDCTYYVVEREFGDDESLPIGFPCKNSGILVLNDRDLPAEEDEIGELCVRGTSLALGYYNNPSKTAEVFVQNPLQSNYKDLIYRTGDLVKYNSYGEIEYCGRKDNQIKHMGHRIELGEIETAMSGISGVESCVCLYDDNVHAICMFYVGEEKDKKFFLDCLQEKIPAYMFPSKFFRMDSLPINQNGKIDRKKLRGNL